ncbi:MAG: hypothetical protein CL910_15520 [Deltaproteobacteria bacterium]|jgi:uncharacterized membrane protein|nr:hypothetical protein [Deltaproteobacteria bacterium]
MVHRHPFRQPPPPVVGLVFLGLVAVAAYPFLLEWGVARFGVRAVALTLLLSGGAGLAWRWGRIQAPALRPTQLAILALLALSAAWATRGPLLYVPAAIQLGLAAYFLLGLREEDSVVERMAHFMQPWLPDWVRPYCRVVTGLWAAFFVVNAAAIVALAASGDLARWQAWTGVGLYLTAAGLQLLESVFRKTWFRAFDEGPVDRVFRRLFPPEHTARGRRSMAYIAHMRVELGMDPPGGPR